MSHGFEASGSSFLEHELLLQAESSVTQSSTSGAGPCFTGAAAGQELLAAPANPSGAPSRYESQKRRDWNTFGEYLHNHRPPLALAKCSGAHVLEFLRYLDQFGKTRVHAAGCPFFGLPQPPAPCGCPLRQAWGSLDALIGRLRAAYEENGGKPESNPFGTKAVRLYLRQVRETQAKARGIAYEKKKRKKPQAAAPPAPPQPPPFQAAPSMSTLPNSIPVLPPLAPPPPPPSFPSLLAEQFHHPFLNPSLRDEDDDVESHFRQH